MKPTITMFCQDCGEQITGQFAASCRKCVSSRAADNRHSLQQLKAEIAAKKKPERPYSSDYEEGCIDGYNDAIDDVLRQLSAV